MERSALVGAWRVVRWERHFEDGMVQAVEGEGLAIFAADGHFLATLIFQGYLSGEARQPAGESSARQATEPRRHLSYGGRFSLDGDRLTNHVELSTRADWLGGDQVRFVDYADGRLTLTTPPTPYQGRVQRSRLTWERAGA